MILINTITKYLSRETDIAPLITFRILFGAMMLVGTLRFAYQGWIEKLYIEPTFFFTFYGFEWIQPMGEVGIYFMFALIACSALLVMIGLFYRLAIITFFLSFSYVELLDATYYLNHYYLVCLVAFILIFLPAHRAYSLDVLWRKKESLTKVPAWTIQVLILQLTIVYVCAGIAKLNPDWLFRAMPLAAWLPEHNDLPILGRLFDIPWIAYVFSWAGAFYDLTIAFFLMHPRTRPFAYGVVVGFHVLTGLLFNIGMFPVIMIVGTLVFFSGEWHRRILELFGDPPLLSSGHLSLPKRGLRLCYNRESPPWRGKVPERNWGWVTFANERNWGWVKTLLLLFFLLQLLLPFRHHFYDGNLLWTEEGYRFSWRVMLVEKSGTARFQVHDPESGRFSEIQNSDYLTAYQEKQMSIQPDFMVQYAHFLKKEFQTQHGIANPVVTVDARIALNGRSSQRFIDPEINLSLVQDDFRSRQWVIPFKE